MNPHDEPRRGTAAIALVSLALGLLPACLHNPASQHIETASAPGEVPLPLDGIHQRAAEGIDARAIQSHVDLLAADALAGRWARAPEARIAARYIAEQFDQAGLAPAGDDDDWWQALDDDLAPNVVGRLSGRGHGWVLVGAHYDHLKPRSRGSDRIFNGADDNASGVAALLELAAAFGELPEPLEASIVFVAFTGEELGLLGSRFFVEHPPIELASLRAAVNMDMISRGKPGEIFCEGGGRSPWLRALTDRANERVGLSVRHDEHPEWTSSSDHFPFIQRDVPTLYFGVEDHADYHRVSDHADRILPELAADVARLVFWILLDAATGAPS